MNHILLKPAWRYWTGFLFLPVVVVLMLLSTDVVVSGPQPTPQAFTYEEHEPGAVLASVPAEGEVEPVFEMLVDLALADDQQSFYALDALAAKIYRFDLDGGLLSVMGRRGRGPGEMESPSALQPAPEGVWALDPQGLRATLWGPDGEVVKMLSLADGGIVATMFVPVGGGLLLPVAGPPTPAWARQSQPDERFFHLSDEGSHPVSGEPGVELDLVPDEPDERLLGLQLARTGADEVVAVRNAVDLGIWRISFDAQARRITDVASVAVPAPVLEAVEELDELPPDMAYRPVSGVRVAGDEVWAVTAGLGEHLLAFTVPKEGDDRVVIVRPGELYKKGLRDAIVLPDRIIAASDTEIVIVERVPIGPSRP